MSAPFTAGPWYISPFEIKNGRAVRFIMAVDNFPVACLYGRTEIDDRNARLIAAAPDLYAVIEEWLAVGNNLADRKAIREKARAALAGAVQK